MTARELGTSVRTLIRHEQGQNRTSWLRLPLKLRLHELESNYAEEKFFVGRQLGLEPDWFTG